MFDIAHFFYCCSSNEAIDDYKTYLKVYYESLANHLEEMGEDFNELFPYEEFLKQWKKNSNVGMMISIQMLKVMMSDPNETPDLSKISESGQNLADAFRYEIAREDEYVFRIKHILRHFVEEDQI